jgi:hypothetical protein
LILVVNNIFSAVLFGMESLDQDEKISFRALVRSKLFIAFSLPYIRSAIILPLTYFMLTTYALDQPLQAAFYVSVINIIGHIVGFTILYVLARKSIKIDIPWKSISKYIFASAVAGALLFILPQPMAVSQTAATMDILFYIAKLLALTGVGAIVYLGVLLAIDKEARTLPRSVLQEIKGKRSVTG